MKTLNEKILASKLFERELAIASRNMKRLAIINFDIADLRDAIRQEREIAAIYKLDRGA